MVKSFTLSKLDMEDRGTPFLNQVQETDEVEVEQLMVKMEPRDKYTGLFAVIPLNVRDMGVMVVPEREKGLN